jgi:hypothetical protein
VFKDLKEFECRTLHGTHIDIFTAVNCRTIADPNFKSITKCSGLEIDESKFFYPFFIVINLYGMFQVIFQYYVSLLHLKRYERIFLNYISKGGV